MKLQHMILVSLGVLVAACSSDSDPAPVNTAPVATQIADVSISANVASAPIAFSVADEDPSALTIDVASDNQQVIADADIVVAGSNANRSLVLTPVSDQLGSATISLVVSDAEGLSVTRTFLATVVGEQRSLTTFVRDAFAATGDDEPVLINAIEFTQDADGDDFADLISP